ncbi:MAG: alpha-amylase [Myxococcota bacterium]|jgi:alpha-amylase
MRKWTLTMRNTAALLAVLVLAAACKERPEPLKAADPIGPGATTGTTAGGGTETGSGTGESTGSTTAGDSTGGDTTTGGETTGGDTTGGTDGGPVVQPIDPASLSWPGWDNATVYFLIMDRFFDGNPANNQSYGRKPDGGDEVGTFHGGDLKGLTQKLNDGFFQGLGVSAIWITAPYEQIHGWVVGGGGNFKHYSYHGYYPLDWTQLDANFGTESELREFVDTAHSQGIRVVFDVVLNHAGYATSQDLHELGVDVLLPGWEGSGVSDYYDFIDFDSPNWKDWWGPQWVRAKLPGYSTPGNNPLTQQVSFLPDFKTESPISVDPPAFYAAKAGTTVTAREDYRVRDYVIEWLTAWVENYGIDGFRCDTVKHVEPEAWAELAVAADAAHAKWRAANPDKAFPDSEYPNPANTFWMTGEVFPHGVVKDAYFDNGFESIINFEFVSKAGKALADPVLIDPVWQGMADSINVDPDFNVLTYISSHDTDIFFDKHSKGDLEKQKTAAALLLLSPGAVQVFYGDENARPEGEGGGDATQGTRSDYEWGANPGVLTVWQRIGVFRKAHRAVGAGSHNKLADSPYTFARRMGDDPDDDRVIVVLGAQGSVPIDVSTDFADGELLRDAYTGQTAEVVSGSATFVADGQGVILIELAPLE